MTAPQLAVAAQPLQYEATGGRSGISERRAATNSARAGVKTGPRGPAKGKCAKGKKRGPAKGNAAKGVAKTGNKAKGVPATGKTAKGVDRLTLSGEFKEDLFRRILELPKSSAEPSAKVSGS